MSARDELAAVIGSKLDRLFGSREFGPAKQDFDLADELISAGYSKPRTITTAEELDALPSGSVVLDRRGLSLHLNYDGWGASTGQRGIEKEELERDAFPTTVLYSPKESK